MTSYAHRIFAGADHGVTRVLNPVMHVAGDASRKAHRVKHTLVWPGIEKLLLKHMAGGADSLDRGDAWRRSAVAAVARRTRRGA